MWLKWTLFRNSMRSRRAVVGRAAAALGMLLGVGLSLLTAAGLGAGAYFLSAHAPEGVGRAGELQERAGFVVMLFIFTIAFVMWALTPLMLGGGDRFEPSRMLLYPVSLVKLFAFDFLSDLTSLAAVFIVPAILAIGVGVGLGRGHLAAGLLIAGCAVAFGLSLSKLLSVGVGALMRSRRTRGETLLALLGATLGMTGVLLGQLMPFLERHSAQLGYARWTPPGAVAYALSYGLGAGGAGDFLWSLLTLDAYAAVCLLLAYRVARRTALGTTGGGGGAKRASVTAHGTAQGTTHGTTHGTAQGAARDAGREASYAGWQLPFGSSQFSALVEKELRYALRNAQLRVIALMAVGLTIVLRAGPAGVSSRRTWGMVSPYADGAGAVFSVLYIFMLVSPISTNLFGYDGAGMRALVLSPASRRTMLVAKNVSVTLVALVLVTVGVFVGGLVFGDLTPRTLLFAALTFVTTAALFAPFGNWLSLQFPKRVQFGKRMNRSGVAGLLLLPVFLLLLVPPAGAVAAAHFAQSHVVKYVILAALALLSVGFYALVVPLQGRSLERRELEVLEAVTGKGGGEDSQITG
jgi:ABC-2 type transport system permease protein